jgi:hypothetical protein
MPMGNNLPMIAVVTSTIGRDSLHQTIKSVENQTIKARHYVFVHGIEFWDKSKLILDQYPDVVSIYLPNNNGGNSYGMACVYALAPFVVNESILSYLDDDNFYELNHLETTVNLMEKTNSDWVYSLRKIVANDGSFICFDDSESLGLIKNASKTVLVDNSCYVLKTETARKCSHAWYYPMFSDRHFLLELSKQQFNCAGTGKFSVNYRVSTDSSNPNVDKVFLTNNALQKEKYKEIYPWRNEIVFKYIDNKLIMEGNL